MYAETKASALKDPLLKGDDGDDVNASSSKIEEEESETNTVERDEEEEEDVRQVGYCALFRFAGTFEGILLFFGLIFAAGMGAAQVYFIVTFGDMVRLSLASF